MIDVCLLGNGGMMPLPDRPLSATLFRIGAQTILFDCGEGTQVNWRYSDLAFRPTSTILLSHLHADHIVGLPGVLFQIAFSGRTEPLTIYGPERTADVVSGLLSVVGQLPFELRIGELEGGETFVLDDVRVSTIRMQHRIPCLGYSVNVSRAPRFNPDRARDLGVPIQHWKRLQSGETVDGVSPEDVCGPPRRGLKLSLITDTSYFDDLVPFVVGSDLLVCEAMFSEDEDLQRAGERGHMTFSQSTALAREARVRQLWLTHFSPRIDDPDSYIDTVRSQFPGTEIGRRGLKTTLAFDDE